jgi:hypothetical protein
MKKRITTDINLSNGTGELSELKEISYEIENGTSIELIFFTSMRFSVQSQLKANIRMRNCSTMLKNVISALVYIIVFIKQRKTICALFKQQRSSKIVMKMF